MALPADVSVSSVRLSPQIPIPGEMYCLGPGLGAGMLFGAIGAAAASSGDESAGQTLRRYAEEHGIDIRALVRGHSRRI